MGQCLSTTMISSALLVMLAVRCCRVAELQAKFAFFPPPPSYRLSTAQDASGACQLSLGTAQKTVEYFLSQHREIRVEARMLQTAHGHFIPLLQVQHSAARCTLIWSHGNAEDAGEALRFCLVLAVKLKLSVAIYDYPGYGVASGSPRESTVCASISCVYEYLTTSGTDPQTIILYGQSVGSGPSVWLASRKKSPLAGLILHAPLASGLTTLIGPAMAAACCSPVCIFSTCDMFPNAKRIRRVACPSLFIHGTDDEVIDVSASTILHERCREPFKRTPPYYVQGAGHSDVQMIESERYFEVLDEFLHSIGRPRQDPVAMSPLADTLLVEMFSRDFHEGSLEASLESHAQPLESTSGGHGLKY
eukprot:CAMPEP_0119316164 /NCGR_PEP_ID=MMETSP1333-20130426/38778_1 /TAXON_ID=418940 /ORGANISM="Scyphosphaera apsteinii, Strain RCC1455" /LENGTH=361 /DNA_ID=CAMNT_0007321741 /DNA_START=29 /DNA_END=1114 /DNA_ORIENTATION=+